MRRYAFELGSVLRVRRVEEDQAAGALAVARSQAAAAGEDARRCRSALGAIGAPPTPTVEGLLVWQDQVTRRRLALDAARAAEREALRTMEERRDAWSAAAMRVSALERLEERRRLAHRRDARRAEMAEVDDLVARRGREA